MKLLSSDFFFRTAPPPSPRLKRPRSVLPRGSSSKVMMSLPALPGEGSFAALAASSAGCSGRQPYSGLDAALNGVRPAGQNATLWWLLVLAGVGVYGVSSLWIVCPVYLAQDLQREWLSLPAVSQARAAQLLSLPSTLTFATFAVGSVAMTLFADTFGRRPATVASAAGALALGAVCAAAPNLIAFSVLRTLLGIPLGCAPAPMFGSWSGHAPRSALISLQRSTSHSAHGSLCSPSLRGRPRHSRGESSRPDPLA